MKTLFRVSLFALFAVACVPCAYGRARASGYCQQGGQTIQVLGYVSSAATPVQASYTGSGCNVLVLYSNGGSVAATGPSGLVSTSGTAVTWLAGNVFNANGQWTGLTITINAVTYTISTCASAASCTLTSSAGTQTSVAYSMSAATPAAIFSDNAGTPKSNPFSVSATGYWFYYADNGSYANQYSGTAVQTTYTNAALPLSDPSNLPNAIRWNATLGTTFAQQCTAATAAPNTAIVVDTVAPVATGFTAACPVIFYPGGMIQPASGQTVTFTVQSAGLSQICDVSLGGSCTILGTNQVPVTWFGATGAGNATADTAGVVAALASVCASPSSISAYGSKGINFPPATTTSGYLISTHIPMPCGSIIISGSGRLAPIIYSGTGAAFDTNSQSYVTFNNIFLASSTGTTANQVGIHVNGASSSSNTKILYSYIAAFGTAPPASITGCGVQVDGDNLQLEIGNTTFEVAGTGTCINGTVDGLNIHDNSGGSGGGMLKTGWWLTIENSAGSANIKIDHNRPITTPGGAINAIGNNGGLEIYSNGYEALTSGPGLSNSTNSAFHFDSSPIQDVHDNVADLHFTGQYCFSVANSDYGTFHDNTCSEPTVSNWNLTGAGIGQMFCSNTDAAFDVQVPYSNPNFIGICHTGPLTGYRGLGTPYPQAPWHLNAPLIPYNFSTTLSAAITSTSQTSISLTDSTGQAIGNILEIGLEQMAITVASPCCTVFRGINGTTAATAINGAAVTNGPGCMSAIGVPSGVSGSLLCGGVGNDPVEGQPFGYIKSIAAGAPTWTPIPLYFFSSAAGTIPLPFASIPGCTSAIEGKFAAFTDSTTNTWGATITGGGSNHVRGNCNGTNWTVEAK